MGEYLFRIKRFLRFEPVEIRHIIISVLVLAFIWAFNDGAEVFDFTHWILNYIKVVIMVVITMLMHLTAQKLIALHKGYRVEYRMWSVGLIIGVILTLLTNGKFPFLAAGGPVFYHLAKQRIGDFRYGLNYFICGIIAAVGIYANLVFAMMFKTSQWIFSINSPFLDEFFIFTLVFVFYMSLPIPPLTGVMIFYSSKLLYVFLEGVILMYLLLAVILNVFSIIWGIILGAVVFVIYYWVMEKGVTD